MKIRSLLKICYTNCLMINKINDFDGYCVIDIVIQKIIIIRNFKHFHQII